MSSEPLSPEHGYAKVDKQDDGYREQNALNDGHIRSRLQISPSIEAANTTIPITTRKSPMARSSLRAW
jgi:hypothetical protein